MNDKPLLEIKNAGISLKVDDSLLPITQDISFDIMPGKILALVGESGCGKSVTALSLLRLLAPQLEISKGEILFRRESGEIVDIAKLSPKGKDIQSIRGDEIAMIFQEPMSSFSPLHTIGSQIVEAIRVHNKVSKKEAHNTAITLLKKVGIADAEGAVDRYPGAFSGGMRQRAMIAKALSCNPRLLIADEPTTALDVTIQAQILTVLKGLQTEYGMSVIFISHNMGVVAQVADEVAIMYMGRIVERGSVEEIFRNPKHPYTISLLNAVPRLGNLEDSKRLEPIEGTVPSLFERPEGCPFGPRCKEFIEGKCNTTFPSITEIETNHEVYCYLYK
jgi:peptide/nickel transport system ATP-binding protein